MTSCGIDYRYSISGTKLSDLFCEGQSASLTSFFNFLFLQIPQIVGKTFVVSTKKLWGINMFIGFETHFLLEEAVEVEVSWRPDDYSGQFIDSLSAFPDFTHTQTFLAFYN